MSHRFAGSLQAGSGWNILIVLAGCLAKSMQITEAILKAYIYLGKYKWHQ
jgi:hypothetical protein